MTHRNRIKWGDLGLSLRMFLSMFLLAVVYLIFMTILWQAGVGFLPMAVIAGGMLLAQYYFSDKLVLATMGARVVSPEEAPELHEIIGKLAAAADLPMPKVAVVQTDMPNAFATGRNPKNAVVATTTGLLRRLTWPEVEAVLGHEMTHVKNRDVAVITMASFFSTVAAFIVQNFLFFGAFGGGYGGGRDRNNSGIIVLLVSAAVWVVSYFLVNALSRYREYAADRGSAYLTGSPSQLASALLKISGQMERVPARDLRQAETLNAFFIIPAIRGEAVMELLSTHPSLEHRLQQLQRLTQELESV